MPDGDVVAMKDAEFQWLASSDPRLAAYAASRLPAWLWTADGRQILWANPAGARAVRRGQCRSPCRKNLRTGRPAPAADRAARRPVARERRHPAGALAGIWRGARHACDLRRFAARLSRWQPRRSDRRRQHRADRAATGADAVRQRDAASRHIIRAALIRASLVRASLAAERPAMPVIEQPVAPQPAPDDQQPAPSGEAPAGFALFDAFAEPAAADEPPAAETIPPATETIARAPPPAIEAFAGQAAGAPPAAALHLADGSGRPLHARHQRIHRPDRPAHHGRFRPAMARDRRDLRIRSHRPDDAGLCDGRHLERHHAELAGGRRRHLARRTVRPADLRCGAKLHRLSRHRRLPRFRRHRAARRPAAGGIVRRNGDAARTVRCAICRADRRCIAFIRRIA